jgi:flagellar basal body-associated protein FliL
LDIKRRRKRKKTNSEKGKGEEIFALTIMALIISIACALTIIFGIVPSMREISNRVENLKMDYDNFSNQVAKGIVDYTLSDEFLLNIQDSIAKLGVLTSNTFISFVKGCCQGLCCCGIGR